MTVGTLFRKRSILLVASGAVAASGIFAISNVFASSAQLPPSSVISVTSKQISRVHLDRGRRGQSAGDVDIVRSLLYDKSKHLIGHAEMICTATGSRSGDCDGTFFLPKGKIVVQGPRTFPQLFEVAVVGGTGLFDSVRGTLTVTSLGGNPPRQLVYFRLLA